MNKFVDFLLKQFVRFPKFGGLFGLFVALLFGYLGLINWQEMQAIPDEPIESSVSEAASLVDADGKNWVTLEDVVWDCENIVDYKSGKRGRRTAIIFTDETASMLGLATFSATRRLSCEDIDRPAVTGVLEQMDDSTYERLPERGFNIQQYENATVRLTLCQYCGRGNSMIGIILAFILVPIGLAMYPMFLHMQKQQEQEELS